jgi:hypothetical protein
MDFPPVLLLEYYYNWPDADDVCLQRLSVRLNQCGKRNHEKSDGKLGESLIYVRANQMLCW